MARERRMAGPSHSTPESPQPRVHQAGGNRHQVTLITRAGCHLCQDAETVLRALALELSFGYREVDVDSGPELRAAYSDRVPVILIDGKEHGYWRVEQARFRKAIAR